MKRTLIAASMSLLALTGAAKAMDDVVIAFAGTENIENDAEYVFIKAFADSLAENGVNSVIHPSNTMGKESDRFDQVSQGLIHLNMGNMGALFKASDYAHVLFLPFITQNQDTFDQMVEDINAFEKVNEEAVNIGVRVVSFPMRGGTLGLFNTEKPITKMEDVADMRFRAMNGDQVKYFEAWGAKPTIVSWPEVPNALQTGVAVGYFNPPSSAVAGGHTELLKHFTPLNAGPVARVAMISDDWYQDLSAEEQGWVDEAVAAGTAANRAWAAQKEEYFTQVIQDDGIKLSELEEGERAKFLEATQAVWSELVEQEDIDEITNLNN